MDGVGIGSFNLSTIFFDIISMDFFISKLLFLIFVLFENTELSFIAAKNSPIFKLLSIIVCTIHGVLVHKLLPVGKFIPILII